MLVMNYIKTWKEVILRPSDFYKRMPTTGGYTHPLTFAAINLIINVLLSALVRYGMFTLGVRSSILILGGIHDSRFNFSIFSNLVEPFILGMIGIFIIALILNFLYKTLGGTGSFEGTVRFISYARAPNLFAWIPILGLITGIYSLYLNIVGGMIVHEVSMKKSTIAVLLPIVIFFILFVISIVVIVLFNLSHLLYEYLRIQTQV